MRKFTRLSILLSLSVILNTIESFIPLPIGIKLGLANVVTLFVLYQYSFKDALYINVLRVFLTGILRTGLFSVTFFFSLSGALLSVIMMYLSKKITKLSIVGISIIGSIFHSIGQVIIAIFILQMNTMIYYLPYLLLFSIPTGIIVGITCKQLIKYYSDTLTEFEF